MCIRDRFSSLVKSNAPVATASAFLDSVETDQMAMANNKNGPCADHTEEGICKEVKDKQTPHHLMMMTRPSLRLLPMKNASPCDSQSPPQLYPQL